VGNVCGGELTVIDAVFVRRIPLIPVVGDFLMPRVPYKLGMSVGTDAGLV